MIRALVIVAVTALLVLPMLSARGQAEPAASTREHERAATADAICLDHYGVRSTTRTLVTCADGALHRWNGGHVQHRVPVLSGAAGSR